MRDEDYLDEMFPKGDKRRGEAMVLLALSRLEGVKLGEVKTAKFFDEYCDGIREAMSRIHKRNGVGDRDKAMGMSNACASIEEECRIIINNNKPKGDDENEN